MSLRSVLLVLGLIAAILPCVLCDPAHIGNIGEACGQSSSLCPQHSSCLSQACQCDQGYVSAVDSRSCLPLVNEWEGACTDSVQCKNFPDAVCRDGLCECDIGHHFLHEKCWVNRKLNEHCQNSDECLLSPHQDRIECSGGSCRCKSGYQENDLGDDCNGGTAVWSLGLVSLMLIASVQIFFN